MAIGLIQSFKFSDHFIAEWRNLDNISISANSSVTNQSFSIAKAGYTPVGIIGFELTNASSSGGNSSWCSIRGIFFSVSSETVAFSARNHHTSSDAKVRFYVYMLYEKEV